MIFLVAFFAEIILLFFLSKALTRFLSRFFLALTKSQKATIAFIAILFFPGVVVHELSHLFVAGILFVRAGEIEFMPKIIDGGVKLGSVSIAKTDPIRRAIIGFAPVFVGLLIIFGIVYYLIPFSSFWGVSATPESVFGRFWTSQNDGLGGKLLLSTVIFYLIFAISNTMFSSKKDLEGTLELLLIAAIIFLAFYIIGFRINVVIPIFVQEKFLELIKNGSIFLLVPIILDLVIITLVRGRRLFQKT